MGKTEERLSKFEDKSVEIFQYKQQSLNGWEKLNRVSGTCGKVLKCLTFMLLVPEKKKKNAVPVNK